MKITCFNFAELALNNNHSLTHYHISLMTGKMVPGLVRAMVRTTNLNTSIFLSQFVDISTFL
jgi:hypothetical protein